MFVRDGLLDLARQCDAAAEVWVLILAMVNIGNKFRGAARRKSMNDHYYLEMISLVERLHRQFLEVVKLELDALGIHDINNVQGMMLFNIGDAEMMVGELTLRGCYP